MAGRSPIQPESPLWDTVKSSAQLSVSPLIAAVYARVVFDGQPYTGVGATTNAALTDLYERIRATQGGGADA